MSDDETQDEARRLLADPASHGGSEVEVVETHANLIFLGPELAFKMKKAVRYPYLDYGTLDRRRRFCEAEVEINRRTAPEIYLDAVPVTRESGETLALDGAGEPVEWVVRMKRFDDDMLLDRLARRGELTARICRDAADVIFDFHERCGQRTGRDAAADMIAVADGNFAELRRHGAPVFDVGAVDQLAERTRQAIEAGQDLLRRRAAGGAVRHVHGDLHLRNIVLLDRRPTLFDAIEFDPALSDIDVLYDLAFLLMDLLHRDLGRAANLVMNRYLARGGDYRGVRLLPLYLSLRAGIRAHTSASAAAGLGDREKTTQARAYLDLALKMLEPDRPRAVAIGGASGTGKSTAAAMLAPALGPAAGAAHLRSDVIRKRLKGRRPEERLGESAYSSAVSRRVFHTLAEEARTVIDAGRPVVVDAVFGHAKNIDPLHKALDAAGVTLEGFWLDADPAILRQRVGGRHDDASDADERVLAKQLGNLERPADWRLVDASGSPEETVALIRAALAAPQRSG